MKTARFALFGGTFLLRGDLLQPRVRRFASTLGSVVKRLRRRELSRNFFWLGTPLFSLGFHQPRRIVSVCVAGRILSLCLVWQSAVIRWRSPHRIP